MKTVFLDTSFVMSCAEFKVDYITEIRKLLPISELSTLDLVIKELDKLAEGRSKKAVTARLARTLINKVPVIITNSRGHTDNLLLERANPETIIATQDMALKRRLRAKKLPLIDIRQKKYLQLIGI
jgi:rRNA-processing protein FCF1